jgi:hypothetical protein
VGSLIFYAAFFRLEDAAFFIISLGDIKPALQATAVSKGVTQRHRLGGDLFFLLVFVGKPH